MIFQFLIKFALQITFFKYVNSITINAIIYSSSPFHQTYSSLIEQFNDYSKENYLDIFVDLTLFTATNITSNNDYVSMIESFLKKKSNKYDLFFYDNIFSEKVSHYFLDLNKYIPKEHIDMYDPRVISQSCQYGDKLTGLPVYLFNSNLCSNKYYLNKYNITVPKTWSELLNTSKYIINEEKKLNNSDVIGFVGSFNDDESGTNSLYEFIYTFRNTIDSPFPEFLSQNSIEAIE
eukprot:jgi/Orpsp1_1/1182011/evm.model.c7180000079518.2